MHSRVLVLAQTADKSPEFYEFAFWTLIVLLGSLVLAVLAMRLIHMMWKRRDQRERAVLGLRGEAVSDPWAEAANRIQPDPDDGPEEDDDESR